MITALLGSAGARDPAARIDRLEALEWLKSAACARRRRGIASAVVDAGSRPGRWGAQVGLARHESPHRGRRPGWRRRWSTTRRTPWRRWERGDINEHRAQLVADGVGDPPRLTGAGSMPTWPTGCPRWGTARSRWRSPGR